MKPKDKEKIKELKEALRECIPPLQSFKKEFEVWGAMGKKEAQILDSIINQAKEALK